jgi:hypothetical protein
MAISKGNMLIRNMKVLNSFLKDIESNKFKLIMDDVEWTSDDEDSHDDQINNECVTGSKNKVD